MATVQTIKAAARSRAGKGAARAERRAGRVPGIIYGDGKTPLPIRPRARRMSCWNTTMIRMMK